MNQKQNTDQDNTGPSLLYLIFSAFCLSIVIELPLLFIALNTYISPGMNETIQKFTEDLPVITKLVITVSELFYAYPVLYVITVAPYLGWHYLRVREKPIFLYTFIVMFLNVAVIGIYVLGYLMPLIQLVQNVQ